MPTVTPATTITPVIDIWNQLASAMTSARDASRAYARFTATSAPSPLNRSFTSSTSALAWLERSPPSHACSMSARILGPRSALEPAAGSSSSASPPQRSAQRASSRRAKVLAPLRLGRCTFISSIDCVIDMVMAPTKMRA